MRIGLDYRPASVAPRSGIGRQVLALERAFRERPGASVQRFTEAPLGAPERTSSICPPWASPLGGLQRPQVRLRFEARFLPAALDSAAIEVYVATANMGLPLARKPRHRRQVLLLHDLFQLTEHNYHRSRLKAFAYRGIDRMSIAWSVAAADRVWCPSRFTLQETRRLFPAHAAKLRVLPNFVAMPEAPADAAPAGLPARYWLAVGTREPRKNAALLLQAWSAARQGMPQVPDLVLVGNPADLSPTLTRQAGLHWLQDIDDAALQACYAAAECLWQPSRAEGFGLPVVEALAHGTPVAVASGSALDEVAPPDSPRFAPDDVTALTDCMLRLAGEPPLRLARLNAWAANYGWAAYAARVGELLDELEPQCP